MILLVAVVICDFIAYRGIDRCDEGCHMVVSISQVDRSQKTFIATSFWGNVQEYRVDGDLSVEDFTVQKLTYEHVFQWYRFFWQDEHLIRILDSQESTLQ